MKSIVDQVELWWYKKLHSGYYHVYLLVNQVESSCPLKLHITKRYYRFEYLVVDIDYKELCKEKYQIMMCNRTEKWYTSFMITNCWIECFVWENCCEHTIDSINRIELIGTWLIPDIVSWQITCVVYKIYL